MIRVNNLAHCIVLSIVIHVLVLYGIFYKNNKKNVFIQVPFEVSFYSPVQVVSSETVEQKEVITPVEEAKPVEEVKPKKEIVKPKKPKKDAITVKKKEQKKEVKKTEEKVVENKVVEEKKEVSESSGASGGPVASSSKGIMLENKNFKYSYYTNTIVKKISKYWQWSSSSSAYRSVIYFRIAKDGTVYDIKVTESSSDENFDNNAVRAVQLASPFAPLPVNYEDDYLGVYFEFKFKH